MNIPFKGTKWYKCDLHLHSPASKCFQDASVTPEQWVAKVIEKGLNCIAVTDHNTGEWIDKIKQAAAGKDLIVFPGVEITCDTSKVHLLVLFDVNKTSNDINDFLIRCGIDRKMFADELASSKETIFQIAEKAHDHGALVIPAHIDEFSGLSSISFDNINNFFDLPYINAIQFIHKPFFNASLQFEENEELLNYFNACYSSTVPTVEYSKFSEWYKPIKIALTKKIALTTFSDNPHEPKNPKHGLDGIGEKYTWIKMDENPTLEGLRQAFLLPDFRVQNCFFSPLIPYKTPDLWIKSISIQNTTITDKATPLIIDFSPQLTTIIGGRGSGKSSILRFVRGVFNRSADIDELNDILEDQTEFYKVHEQRTQKGVLTTDSIIDIEFVRNGILYKITASEITNSNNQTVYVQKYDSLTDIWNYETSESFIDFFQFEQYSQKQIYEIAQEPNSLRERIDSSIESMDDLKNEREIIKKSFLEKSAAIRTMQQQIIGKGKLQTEIADFEERIKLYKQSGIASLLLSREKFIVQKKTLSGILTEIKNKEKSIDLIINSIEISNVDLSSFDTVYSDELSALSESIVNNFSSLKSELQNQKLEISKIYSQFAKDCLKSKWKVDFDNNRKDFYIKKEELEKQGIEDIANFEKLVQSKETKEKELAAIVAIEKNLTYEGSMKQKYQSDFLTKTKEITLLRQAFASVNMHDEKVSVTIKPFRNKADFINKLRTIIQRSDSFQSDVDILTNLCFNGNVEQTIISIRELFFNIRSDGDVENVSGHFINLVYDMSDAQIDEIELLLPEDEIEIKYKPSGSQSFKPLTTASAGQKTAAILTFILSQGNIPLILDQPEDDLDNRLVYELVVDRLKQSKEHRQIIVVTHNANIPVNGDSEYILSMNSESKKLKVLCSGSVEQPVIKKEICDVMEGGEQAFEMRYKRYKMFQ